jgi:uncharacterized cupredoxin-like copper-binding protein
VPASSKSDANALSVYAIFISLGAFALATLSVVVVALTGSTSSVATAPTTSAPLAVTLTEFKITPATLSAGPGDITIIVTNGGTQAHNLQVTRLNAKTPDIQPGNSATLTLTHVSAGTYDVICTIPGHSDAGMKATLTVAANNGSGQSATGTSTSTMDMSATPAGTQPAASSSVSEPACPTTTTTTVAPDATPPQDNGAGTIPPNATVVHVTLGGTSGPEVFGLVADLTTVRAGNVTFVVHNAGTIEHELLLFRTDTPFNQLPIVDGGDPPAPVPTCADKVDEGPKIAETGDPNLVPGETRSFTAPGLTPGKYVLMCNLAGHYGAGMRAAFTVV